MSKLLIDYLTITGIGAVIALTMPGLVVVGFFLFFIPGLLLSLMPSAFLYGAVFAVAWFGARYIFGDGIIAVFAGLIAVGAIALILTRASRTADMDVYTRSILPDMTPDQTIELKGIVYLSFRNPKLNKVDGSNSRRVTGETGFACDSYCLAALFTPGVTAVVIDSSEDMSTPSKNARTYRLSKRPNCESNVSLDLSNIQAPLYNDGKSAGRHQEASRLLVSQWAMKLANEFCLVVGPVETAPDFRIVEHKSWSAAGSPKTWSFGPGSLSTHTVEILSGERLLYRAHKSSMTTLSKIFHVDCDAALNGVSFDWGRTTVRSKPKHEEIELHQVLARHTNLAGKPTSETDQDGIALIPVFRQQLKAALNDRTLSEKSSGFQVMEAYFEAVGSNASEEDVMLIGRLFSDPRLQSYPGLQFLKLTVDQTRQVYDLYTKRLVATEPPFLPADNNLWIIVRKLGPQAIELIGPEQETLLNDPLKRLVIPELVVALGYGKSENAQALLSMLKEHSAVVAEIQQQRETRVIKPYGRDAERGSNINLITAAKRGLCLLGPQASSIRDELDAFLRGGTMPAHLVSGHDRTDWDVILVLMGKPLSSIAKPTDANGLEAFYRQKVKRKVDGWKPDGC
jgi:hypothetical protein